MPSLRMPITPMGIGMGMGMVNTCVRRLHCDLVTVPVDPVASHDKEAGIDQTVVNFDHVFIRSIEQFAQGV